MEKNSILEFSKEQKTEKLKKAYDEFLDRLFAALDDVGEKLKYINPENTKIIPIGESTNHTFIESYNGEVDIIIACSDSQVAIANKTYSEVYQKNSRKTKKEIVEMLAEKKKNTCQEIFDTLFEYLLEYFDSKTSFIMMEDGIKVFANEELGFKFLIRLGTYDCNDEKFLISLWNPVLCKSDRVDIFEYTEKFDEKNILTKGNFSKIVRVFKNFRKSLLLSKSMSASFFNKYAVELVIYNIPNSLFVGDENAMFVKCLNYLDNVVLAEMKDYKNDNIKDFFLSKFSFSAFKIFINKIKKLAFE